jgi:hypothetical protein
MPEGDRRIWDAIWKTKVPQKVKIFNWRLATEALAAKKNRCSRNMTTEATCTMIDPSPRTHTITVDCKCQTLNFVARSETLPERTQEHTGDRSILRRANWRLFCSCLLFQVHIDVAIVTEIYAVHDPLNPRHPTELIVSRLQQNGAKQTDRAST